MDEWQKINTELFNIWDEIINLTWNNWMRFMGFKHDKELPIIKSNEETKQGHCERSVARGFIQDKIQDEERRAEAICYPKEERKLIAEEMEQIKNDSIIEELHCKIRYLSQQLEDERRKNEEKEDEILRQSETIKKLEEQMAELRRVALIGENYLNKWRYRNYF